MYRLAVVIGYKKVDNGYKTNGAVTINRMIDPELTDYMGADKLSKAIDTEEHNTELVENGVWFFKNLTLPQIIKLARDVYNKAPVNTDADLQVSVGDMKNDFINVHFPRHEYLRMHDEQLVRFLYNEINKEMPFLRHAN